MYETDEDLERLQRLLDSSHARAGDHLRSILTDRGRMSAAEMCEELDGIRIIALATTTPAGRPRVAPVDGFLYRGRFHFGSSPDSVRFAHLRQRPHVSATHIRGEELVVIVHGTAYEIDVHAEEHAGVRDLLVELYGQGWEDWAAGAVYAGIEPETMFASRLPGASDD